MAWVVILFESKRKEKPVEEFIRSKDPSTTAKIVHGIDLLEKYGPVLGMPHSKKISKNLYELRIRGKQEVRIIYTFVKSRIYLLHSFKKQSRKTPLKELKIAEDRLRMLTLI